MNLSRNSQSPLRSIHLANRRLCPKQRRSCDAFASLLRRKSGSLQILIANCGRKHPRRWLCRLSNSHVRSGKSRRLYCRRLRSRHCNIWHHQRECSHRADAHISWGACWTWGPPFGRTEPWHLRCLVRGKGWRLIKPVVVPMCTAWTPTRGQLPVLPVFPRWPQVESPGCRSWSFRFHRS